jgi:signal transduction histidine kinase
VEQPLAENPASDSSNESAPERAQIAIVDDENGPRQALRMILKEDYDVYMATDVLEAQDIIQSRRIDLVLTDIRMPRLTGIDLLRWVKNTHPSIEVIMLTGYGHLKTAMKAVSYGAYAYIEKPYDANHLLEQVQEALNKHRREEDRRRLEALALEANRFETLGHFVSGMLHDLGSPLSVIGSQVELMKLGTPDPQTAERLDVMASQVGHCSDIVKTTMSFLREDSDPQNALNLNTVVETCLRIAAPVLRRQKVTARPMLTEDLATFKGDFVLLRQAVLNLVNNACQAMQDQERDRELIIRSWNEPYHVCLSVADTGPGIPPEARTKVFHTFYSTKGDAGTGIGLAVVQSVVTRHGAEVAVQETPGGGATFLLKFPTRLEGQGEG